MRNPIDTVKGRIVDVDEYGEITIKARYDDMFTFAKRGYKDVYIQLIDSRPLSEKQRRACYALIREISDYTGMGVDPTKEYMKIKFLAEDLNETADKIFSLSNAPMSLVCAFQKFLIRFVLEWDIPCGFPLLNMVDDVDDYLYGCLVNKKCCICGQHSDLHHMTAVGMGNDRDEIIHEGMRALPLCRIHHSEIHTIGKTAFLRRYHFDTDGIKLDKDLCRIYSLKDNKDEQ